MFKVWDVRTKNCVLTGEGSEGELNTAVFNNVNPELIAVAGEEDGTIGVWDMRMADMVLNDLQHHNKQVTVLEWHPN
jgi:WD40 repeat protein